MPGSDPNDETSCERGSWVAQDKNGTHYYYGTTDGARIENDQGVFAWKLTEAIDIHGNRAVYEYFRELRWVETPYPHFDGNAQSYLVSILYNEAADGAFKDRIGFNYGGRNDILTSYASGYLVRTVRRLESVTVDTEYQEGQDRRRVRTYLLQYESESYHSMLSSIRLVGNDGVTAYPPISFAYTEVEGRDVTGAANAGVAVPLFGQLDAQIREIASSPDRSVNNSINDLLDVDGDSLPDLFVTDLAKNSGSHTWIKNVDGVHFDLPQSSSGVDTAVYSWVTGEKWLPGGDSLALSNRNVQLLDMDGNGRVDTLHRLLRR